MKKTIVFVVLVSILGACSEEKSNSVEIRNYFSIDSLINAQIDFLITNNALLIKSENNKLKNADALKLDSAQWRQQLEIFRSLDLNKPTYIGAYNIEHLDDSGSNLKILNYTPISDDLPIKRISIYYLDHLSNILRINASVKKSNILYSSTNNLTMEFVTRDDLHVLKNYSIASMQKLILRDSLSIEINGKITY